MKRIILVSASTVVLALGGCSMFDHSSDNAQANAAAPAVQPAYSQSSQPMAQDSAATGQRDQSDRRMAENGRSGNWRPAQQKLKDAGDYSGQIDGKYGPLTARAIREFQKSSGLHQTGRLDQQTASKLGVDPMRNSVASMPSDKSSGGANADRNGSKDSSDNARSGASPNNAPTSGSGSMDKSSGANPSNTH